MDLNDTLYAWQYWTRQWLAGRLYRFGRRRAASPTPPKTPERVLIIITGLIGDTVMSTPVLIEARRLWPHSRVTVLGQRHNCQLLRACPLVDSCVEAPAVPFTLRNRRAVGRLERWLRDEHFDVALILLGDQFAVVLARAGIPVRVGVRGHLLERCLTHTYDIGSPRTWGPAERLNALRTLGCDVQDVAPRLWGSDAAREGARHRLRKLGLADGQAYAVVHPFGSTPRQWWPVERVRELAKKLRSLGLIAILIGGPETQGRVSLSELGVLVDATGALSLEDLLGVLDGATIMVSTDSGPYHMAGALGKPLVGLFRAARPEHAARYCSSRVVFGVHNDCLGCCSWDACQLTPCREMNAITVAQVLSSIRDYIGLASSSSKVLS